uniref:hypothetical protein n=1 Tax=Nonomuraea bangladeshensis TaxID=404385 RepID=UPI003F49AD53
MRVGLWGRSAVESVGARGLVMDVRRTDGKPGSGPVDVEFDYSGFRGAFGGDFGARLRVVALPACALTDPAKAECRRQTTVPTRNDARSGKAFARVMAEPEQAVYALDPAPEGETGDFKATSLSPSMKWAVGNNSGSFSLSYPLPAPQVPGGLVPEFVMSYSSGSVDRHPTCDLCPARTAGSLTDWHEPLNEEASPSLIKHRFRDTPQIEASRCSPTETVSGRTAITVDERGVGCLRHIWESGSRR